MSAKFNAVLHDNFVTSVHESGSLVLVCKCGHAIVDHEEGIKTLRADEMAKLHELHAMSELDRFLGVKR